MRRQSCVVVRRRVFGEGFDPLRHRGLFAGGRLERRVGGNRHVGVFRLVIGWARKRRVHDHQIELAVAYAIDQIANVFRLPSAGGDGAGVFDQARLHMLCEQVERSDRDIALALAPAAVGHGEQALAVERDVGVAAGEDRGGEMHGDVEHIQADQTVFHHRRVQRFGVAAVELVEERDALVGGAEQGAGAAGEVADLEGGDGLFVAPFCAARSLIGGDGESSEQGGRGGAGVEGGEEFSVRDQALEDHAGEVVRLGHAAADQPPGSVPERLEYGVGSGGGQPIEDLAGSGEDRPVVDFEDRVPLGDDRLLIEAGVG